MPLKIIRNDITAMKVDAIVSTANPEPLFAGGTDCAVYKAAGVEKLLKARKKIGKIDVGQAAVTPAFDLDAKYIIHTVGPQYIDGSHNEAQMLASCYQNSLRIAARRHCKSVAFPLISTGVYGFPKEEVLEIAVEEIRRFLTGYDMMIWLVVFDRESFQCSGRLVSEIESYIDERTVCRKAVREYETREDTGCLRESAMYDIRQLSSRLNMERRRRESVTEESKTGKLHYDTAPRPSVPADHRAERPLFSFSRSRSLEDVLAQVGETFQERLLRLIDEKGMSDIEVYRKANLDRKLFSKIRCNKDYRPKKMTAVALAIALELNLDETKDLLGRAEMALSPGSRFDLIIQYFIEHEVYDIYTINLALFQYGLPMLGD